MQIKRIQWDFDAWEDYCEWQQTDSGAVVLITNIGLSMWLRRMLL